MLTAFLPSNLTIDTINNQAWVSIVAFSVKKLRPRFLPSFPFISNFHEVNFRTYVIKDGIPGIYFLSIEAHKLLPVILARLFIGLPYIKSDITRTANLYHSINRQAELQLKAIYKPIPALENSNDLNYWLTERHALYQQNGNKLHRIDVHHKPWPLQPMEVNLELSGYPLIGDRIFARPTPDLTHYAEQLEVLVWGRQTV